MSLMYLTLTYQQKWASCLKILSWILKPSVIFNHLVYFFREIMLSKFHYLELQMVNIGKVILGLRNFNNLDRSYLFPSVWIILFNIHFLPHIMLNLFLKQYFWHFQAIKPALDVFKRSWDKFAHCNAIWIVWCIFSGFF